MPGVVVHTSNPSTQAGGLQVQDPISKEKENDKEKNILTGRQWLTP
jgi:hypothetical protein